jgi:hypothetical protein
MEKNAYRAACKCTILVGEDKPHKGALVMICGTSLDLSDDI